MAIPLATWTLLAPAMLGWGLAVAVPVILHLWNRGRPERTRWAAMAFLQAALRKNARQLKLQQWLLLALRVAAISLLALAVANPVSSSVSPITAATDDIHTVLVLDGSYSMDFRQHGKSLFAQSQELAAKTVAAGSQGDGFSVVVMQAVPRVVIGEPGFDPADVQEELANLKVGEAGANLAATLGEVENLLTRAQRVFPRLKQRRVIFYSDLGETCWGAVRQSETLAAFQRLSQLAQLSLVNLGETSTGNLAVTSLSAAPPRATVGEPMELEVGLANYGWTDGAGQTLQLWIDGQLTSEQTVQIPLDGQATARFTQRSTQIGEHAIEVKLLDDSLPLDNHRYLSLPVAERLRILAVEEKPGDLRQVSLALQPFVEGASLQIETISPSKLAEQSLANQDVVILGNIASLGSVEGELLGDYVRAGGGLIVFLGDLVQSASYNQDLGGDRGLPRSLPGELLSLQTAAPGALDPLDYQHELVAPFRGFPESGLTTIPVWRYVKLRPYKRAKVPLKLANGDPLIVEEGLGFGRTILFATSASAESLDRSTDPPTPWTAFSTWPSFPPLIQETLLLATKNRFANRQAVVGETLEGVYRGPPGEAGLELAGPEGKIERLALENQTSVGSRWSSQATTASGFYELRRGRSMNSPTAEYPAEKYAVNVDPQESNLQSLPADFLPTELRSLATTKAGTPVLSRGTANPWFFAILAGVLGVLVLESLLGRRLGGLA